MYRNKALLNDAKGKPCICCGKDDGTIVAAHYSGVMSHKFGKGTGIKAHDLCADLCSCCHNYYDTYEGGNDYERGFHLLMFIQKSLVRRLESGEWVLKKR